MATSAGAFFAGIGTTFVILAVGFGGGLLAAKSALNEPNGFQRHSTSEIPAAVRVVLPSSAEAAPKPAELPRQQTSLPEPVTQLASEPAKPVKLQVDDQVEKADARKVEAEARDRKRRYAERKAKRAAETRARREQQRVPQQEAPVMAFGGENSSRYGGWSGN
ncbi:hypothetical protein [Bradyrhizobium sp. McL0616]|uniref:hypothetical protein n=1 Tax=Bradyrhizobium sp. McL0616 TaxID=3415674 RepID=UPI003CF3059B